MLTDCPPCVEHEDDYIREWARQRGLDRYPKAVIYLINADREGVDRAEIAFDLKGEPVRRFRGRRLPISADGPA